MTKLLMLGLRPWDSAGDRARRLFGGLGGYGLLYVEPGEGRGIARLYEPKATQKNVTLLSPQGKTVSFGARSLFALPRLLGQTDCLQAALHKQGAPVRVLCCDMPVRKEVLARIPHQKLLYDLHETGGNPRAIRDMARRADLVTVSGHAAAGQVRDMSDKLCYLPDGTRFDLMSRSGDPLLPFPSDLFHIREPILGHIGSPDLTAEMGYVEAAAAANPAWNFVFLGNAPGTVRAENIHFLGEKSPEQLPAYLSHFNLCFRIAEGGAEEDLPPSLFACFASGKPLVTTLFPKRVLDFSEVIYLAHSAESFIEGCHKALAERDAWRRKERVAFARASSWEAGASRLEALLKEKDML